MATRGRYPCHECGRVFHVSVPGQVLCKRHRVAGSKRCRERMAKAAARGKAKPGTLGVAFEQARPINPKEA